MKLTLLDWAVVVAYFVVNLGIGFYYFRRASGSVSEFFISGRSVPWWLAGTSMVATTFAADTPLVVTGIVYRNGIAGNWLWWAYALSGMLTVFFFARLWRRAGVLTDMELAELRYSGKPAAFLRCFRALYLALPVNTIIIGWVNLAMATILQLTLGISKMSAVMFCLGLTVAYTVVSGLWAVLWTDLLQFVLKMGMVIVLAIFALQAVGGIHGLMARLAEHDAVAHTNTLAFVPDKSSSLYLIFLTYLTLTWWASWYPGAEPGGGGYIAQRIFCAKDERHSLGATLWFNVAHYALRPWPWILTALVAVALIPHPANPEGAYVQIMIDHLPASLRGLMLAGFAAAYMSTIGTQINLGASYLLNDVYRRFLVRDGNERHYVNASRWLTILVTVIAAVATYYMSSIQGAWRFLISLGAGAGLVFMLRWFWWRVNAWSEVSAMCAAALSSLFLQSPLASGAVRVLQGFDPMLFSTLDPLVTHKSLDASDPHAFAWLVLLTTAFTTITWLAVTFLTPPEPQSKLREFYERVRPATLGWKPIAGADATSSQSLLWSAADWIAGCALIYCALFGIGKLIFGDWVLGVELLLGAVVCVIFIFWDLNRRGWETLSS
ncbi:MAG: sodium:proline symporter [Acidobacteria bacterium]|nr:MAG: sodium:proline symporter [Acidobacteriota bacterium]